MSRPPWMTRTLVALTAVSLCQDIASELMYPLLPILLTTVLAAPPAVVGVIEGLAEGAAGVAKLIAGRLSDRCGRKPVTTLGYALAVVGKVIVAAAAAWPIVMAGRVTDRLGKGTRSAARDAWLAGSVPPEHLGRAFGFHRMGDSFGAVVGPLLGIAVLSWTGDIRVALWVAVVPAMASVLLVLMARESRHSETTTSLGCERLEPASAAAADEALALEMATQRAATNRFRQPPLGSRFWRACLLLTAVALVNFPDALLLLRLHDLGWSTQATLAGYVVFNLVYSLAALPAGVFADRCGPLIAYAIALGVFAITYAGLGTIASGQHDWRTWALLAAYGLFPAFSNGVGKAWISRTVDNAVRGRAQGVFQAMGNAAVLVAGLWAGLLWTAGPGKGVVALNLAAGLGAIAAVALFITGWRWRRLGSY